MPDVRSASVPSLPVGRGTLLRGALGGAGSAHPIADLPRLDRIILLRGAGEGREALIPANRNRSTPSQTQAIL